MPTSVEWEWAARGGLEGKQYPWGDEPPISSPGAQNGAQCSSFGDHPVPVKTFAPNGYGLYDMVGNLWEWVVDVFQGTDHTGSSYDYHILRGGGYYGNDCSLLATQRVPSRYPNYSNEYYGFRCTDDAVP